MRVVSIFGIIFLISISVGSLFSYLILPAYSYPTKQQDLTYKVSMTGPGIGKYRIITDGRGHVREEVTFFGVTTVNILDYVSAKRIRISEIDRTARVSNFPQKPQGMQGTDIIDDESARKAGAKFIGDKTIGGHFCHGYQTQIFDTISKIWVDNKTHQMICREDKQASNHNIGSIMLLENSSNNIPNPDVFKIPFGYKEIPPNNIVKKER